MSDLKIAGSVAVVTGANRGIGKAIVEELLARGAKKVYAGARRTETLDPLVRAYPDRVVPVALDVTNDDQVRFVARRATDVDLVVNNAGVVDAPMGAQVGDPAIFDAARAEIDVNYFGVLRVTQAFAPVLARNGGGMIVNVASIVALAAYPGFATYSASKAAVRSLTQSSRVHLAGQGTHVLGVYPGPVDTDMARKVDMEKATPAHVAARIADAIEAHAPDVYPDPFAEQFGAQFEASPRAAEEQFAGSPAA